jgi:hypothetical protein
LATVLSEIADLAWMVATRDALKEDFTVVASKYPVRLDVDPRDGKLRWRRG